jgi:hypothetical protein
VEAPRGPEEVNVGWLERVSVTRASGVRVDPAKWEVMGRWADEDGHAIEIVAPSVSACEIASLVLGLLESDWGPLDAWAWIATH